MKLCYDNPRSPARRLLLCWGRKASNFQFSILALLLCSCERKEASQPPSKPASPIPVHLVAVKTGEATRSIVLPATVQPWQQATLYAKVAGYAKTVAVDKGDTVKENTLLAEIEVPELIADRTKYQAELAVAEVDFKRISEAQQKAPDLVVAQSVDTAKAKMDVAKANLERTETLLGFARITAPFSGVITRRFIDPGAFVPAAALGGASQNAAAMFTVMDFSRVRVQTAVPESEVPFIKQGLASKISIDEFPNRTFPGTVTRFSHALDDTTRTMLAEIELPNPDEALRPGMYASARIVVERKPEATIIPADSLFAEKTRNSVFVVADGKARRVTVKTGFNDAGTVEILEGVKPGGQVILLGKQVLADGQPITITEGR
jgi:RND family efflux transporter MFP subunit